MHAHFSSPVKPAKYWSVLLFKFCLWGETITGNASSEPWNAQWWFFNARNANLPVLNHQYWSTSLRSDVTAWQVGNYLRSYFNNCTALCLINETASGFTTPVTEMYHWRFAEWCVINSKHLRNYNRISSFFTKFTSH